MPGLKVQGYAVIKVCRQGRETFLLLYCLFFFSFISFPLSSFYDFSVIFYRFFLIFGQFIDNNLYNSCIHLWVQGQRSRSQVDTRWKCLFSNFSVIYHPIVFKFSWLIVLDKETTWWKFQGRRLKVKITRRQPSKVCCTLISLLFLNEFLWNLAGIWTVSRPSTLWIFRSVRQMSWSQWDKILAKTPYILLFIAPVQAVSLDVSTMNSVDGPSKVTIQSEGRPPCRVSLQVQF